MASKFRSTSTKRRRAGGAHRDIKKRLLLVCGGARTEKDYFEDLKDHCRASNVTVKVRTDTRSPLHVVNTAADLFASAADDFDECWAVFDVDSFDVGESIKVAKRRGVDLAISNPCFEYWLLLHFCDHNSHLSEYKAVRDKIKSHVPNYDKAGIKISDYLDGVEDAVARARKRDENQVPPGVNPNTTVWRIAAQMINSAS
ncbi:RloB family protein [Streptomyces pilosus]|uniref:RloB family protein n=1 Tax=Streptomyces pilosus TaxID=28893 RepID=UPI0036C68CF1